MNIAFDAGAIEVGRGSGIGNYTLHQFKAMAELYPEHNYYYLNLIHNSSLIDVIQAPNFHKIFLDTGKDGFIRHSGEKYYDLVGSGIKNFIAKYDIDVFYMTAPFLSPLGTFQVAPYQKEWLAETATVITVYDVIPYIMRDRYLAADADFKWYMKNVDMIRWTDRQLAISVSAKEDMVNYLGFDESKIDVIYGGVSDRYRVLKITSGQKKALFDKFAVNSEFLLGCVSADQRKNTDGLIKAYAAMPKELRDRYQLVIAGRLPPHDDGASFKRLIKELGMEGRVILTDYVTDEELIMFYNLAKLMVFPSLYEGFGLPLIESWACGTPVLASNNSSLGELAGDTGLTFDPNDCQDMTRGLVKALTSVDLEEKLRLGQAKLPLFTWERVAQLSMDAITLAYQEKQEALAARAKPSLAAVFFNSGDLTENWRGTLSKLARHFSISVFIDGGEGGATTVWDQKIAVADTKAFIKQAVGFDHIVYFADEQTDERALKLMRAHPGSWLLMDEDMDALALMMAGLNKSDHVYSGLAEKMRRYFTDEQKPLAGLAQLYEASAKTLVARARQKNTLLDGNLHRAVYCLDPQKWPRANYSNTELADLAETAVDNMARAIRDPQFLYDAEGLIRHIKEAEIQPNAYDHNSLKALTATLGLAISTDPVTKMIEAADDVLAGSSRLQVDLVTSWNTVCGIAEYTKFYADSLIREVDFSIYPPRAAELSGDDDDRVRSRAWDFHGDMRALAHELLASEAPLVHIQYSLSFFFPSELALLIQLLDGRKKVLVSCHNTKVLVPSGPEERKILNKAVYVVHQERDREVLLGNGLKAHNIHLIPLGQIKAAERDKEAVRTALGLSGRHPVIGSYGFLFPHKGIYETIEAVALLKKTYPEIFYVASCALYDNPESHKCHQDCLRLIQAEGLGDNVRLITDYLKPEESLFLLQSCDVFSMPYADTQESASGAARFCIAARRPLVVTAINIFKEYKDCTLQIEDNRPQNIADGIEEMLRPENYKHYLATVNRIADQHTWDKVAERYLDLYQDLVAHDLPQKI